MKIDKSKFHGIFPALVTPYTKDGAIHEKSLRKLVSVNLEKGVRGFYVGGSTAEAFLLSTEERKQILEIVASENNGRGTLIAHIGQISSDRSIELAQHAKEMGVDAVSSVPPFYYSFTVEEVLGHYLAIVEAVEMPLLLYNFPAFSGFTLTPQLIDQLRSADERIMGLKHTSMNLYDLQQVVQMDEDFVVLSGHDEVFLGALAMGAHGAVGSTYNFMPEIYLGIAEAFSRGAMEEAAGLQKKANSFIRLMGRGPGIPEVKTALEFLGFECNGCRRPIIDPGKAEKRVIERTLKEIGLL